MKKKLVLTLSLAVGLIASLILLPTSYAKLGNSSALQKPRTESPQKLIERKVDPKLQFNKNSLLRDLASQNIAAPGQNRKDGKGLANEDKMSSMGYIAHLAATGQLDRAIAKARAKAAKNGTNAGALSANSVDPGDTGDLGDDDEEDGPAGGQAELSLAVDSTGQHIVVGSNDTRGFALNPTSVSGFAYSDDGGATFTDGGQLPVNTGTSAIGATIFPQVFGDPEVKYLGGSNFVYFSIMVKKISATGTAQTMCVHRSTDFGHTWTGPFEVTPATNPHGLLSGASARDSADKEFADVDPDTGRVMMSWSNFTSTAFAAGGVEISTTYSDNIMTATPPTWSSRSILGATAADGQASIPRFAGNGSANAYVTWRRFSGLGGNGQNVGFARSTDNGVTWSAPVNLTSDFFTMDQVLGNDRVNTSPSMAVDNSTGNIFIVYANNNNHDGSDIAFQRSTDGGLTFSPSVLLNSRPGNDRPQWIPWVTTDNLTHRIYVFYYDQGIASSGDLTETTYLYSDDGGTTWTKPAALTDRPFHAGYGNDTGQPNLGDYNQAVAQNGEVFAIWAGAGNIVPFTDGEPTSTSFTVPDIFFKRVSTAKAALSLGSVTFTESGGNGNIDINDTVNLKLPLKNYVTNLLNASTVTGVSATLSTTTTGVSVTQANSVYPNIAAGTTANNTVDYVLQITQAFVPGTRIELSLNVGTDQGVTTLLYTLPSGTPNATPFFTENFNSAAVGSLPAGWSNQHGGGANIVSWTTNNTLFGTASNAAFHANANDGISGTGNPTRTERLLSPLVVVPANADYVTLDFDVAYDTEDDPAFGIQAYDGLVFRFVDFTPGRIARNVLAESFAEEFTTGAFQHYPKHFPRSSVAAYFQDMSAWSGFSNGFKHVHMKLPGMAGSTIQLRFEFTQDSLGTCADVRPGHQCGVMLDNVVLNSIVNVQPTTLTVDAAAGQYSDVVTLKATVSPNTAGAQTATGNVQFSVNGSPVGSPVAIDGSGVATLPYTIPLAAANYPITAAFTSTNSLFLNSNGANTLTVSREDAIVTPSLANPMSVKVNSPGGTAGPITLTAAINEVADGSLGNISLAVPVIFTFNPVGPGSAPTCTATTMGGGVGGTLTASCTINNVPVNVYDITIAIGGNYYTGSAETVLAVYDPSLGFVSGGGRVVHNGFPANFGFNVKYLKNGNTQGSLLYIEHRPTGDVVLKSNAMKSLSIIDNLGIIIGKATLNGVGNYGFRANVTDNGEPGTGDLFGLRVTNPDGTLNSDLTFDPVSLSGGNIQVPHAAGK